MVETIIKDIHNLSLEKGNGADSLTLKVNSELKKLGFKKAYVSTTESVREEDIESGLTIHFLPYMSYDINYMNRTASRENFKVLRNYLKELEGGYYWSDYYSLREGHFGNQKTLKIEHNNKLYEIGHYLPTKNIVIIYLPLHNNWNIGLKNKAVLEVLGYVKKAVEKYKIKEEDLTKIKEQILLDKFSKGITDRIISNKNIINENSNYIKEYEKKICNWYRSNIEKKAEVEELGILIKKMKSSLLEKIKVINGFKFVKSAGLVDDGIEVKFDEVFIKFNDEKVRMGNYTAKILPNVINIICDKPVKRDGEIFHHVHISGSNVCFGESRNLAMKMLGELDLKKLTHFLWLYLNSFNPGDTYIPMRDWVAGRKNNDVVPDRDKYCNECGEYVNTEEYNFDEDMCNDCWEDRS
jgi:hypothetical protein